MSTNTNETRTDDVTDETTGHVTDVTSGPSTEQAVVPDQAVPDPDQSGSDQSESGSGQFGSDQAVATDPADPAGSEPSGVGTSGVETSGVGPPVVEAPGVQSAGQAAGADDWHDLQGRFVDDPEAVVREAGALIEQDLATLRQRLESGDTEDLRTAFRRYRDLHSSLI